MVSVMTSWVVEVIDLVCWMRRAVCYDETVYPEPHKYDPERFLKDGKLDRSVKDPEDRIFGSGRRYDPASFHPSLTSILSTFHAARSFGRICPGRWLALRSLFLNISSTLSVFNIEAPVGEKLEPKFHETHIRYVMRSWRLRRKPLGEVY